jgi:long-chain acyl-CoA synthetase
VATPATTTEPDAGGAVDGRTIGALWRRAVDAGRENPPYLVERDEGWQPVPSAEAARRVDELANGFLARGISKGDAVAILATTTLEWVLVDFALALIGAVSAPIYPNSSGRDCAYIVEHSEAVLVVAEDDDQREKLAAFRDRLPQLRDVLTFAELEDVERRGREFAAESPSALASAEAAVAAEDLFTYIYTSGTTGPPKGCMIRHRNYYEMALAVERLSDEGTPLVDGSDTMLLYLPLAHNFGRLMHLVGAYAGFTIALLPDPLRTAEALPQVRPTALPSVPRVYEKVYAGVRGQFDAATGVKRRLIDWALRVGYRSSPYRQRGEPLPRGLAAQFRLADRLVYSKVKKRLGGRLRSAISGGAPLAQEIGEFFHAIDITILEGYGLTECTTACSVNRPDRVRFGTVGPALPRFELRVAEDGEILIRSETIFAGYLKDEAATREVLDDEGWLHSGDIGTIDEDGFLRITDRKKDILVTAGGKNVAPQNLENALKAHPLISQALIVGDRKPYVAALITIDPTATEGRPRDALENEVQQIVDTVNADFSRFEQIKRFRVLERDFSLEEGEMTPTLKLKRRVISQRYAVEIQSLYTQ